MAVFMAGQKSRGLLRSQARMTQVCEEEGNALPTTLPHSPESPPALQPQSAKQLLTRGGWVSHTYRDLLLHP